MYEMVKNSHPLLSNALLQISDLMHYSLQEHKERNRLAIVQQEIDQVKNIIYLQQMRFSNKLNLSLTNNLPDNEIHIAPMLIVTITENMFKHGDLMHQSLNASITIYIDDLASQIVFETFNAIDFRKKNKISGIGIANINTRLALIYKPNTYSLITNLDTQLQTYTVTMRVPIILPNKIH